jgi:hypothetical protein
MTNTSIRHPVIFPISAVLAFFLGLCTLFALVTTIAQAWQEHAQSRWPAAMATVKQCRLVRSITSRHNYMYIRCNFAYEVGGEQLTARVFSGSVPPPEVAQYPPNQAAPLNDWLNDHPSGTPVAIRYNPSNHQSIVIASDGMPPYIGPKTPNNLKLLAAVGTGFLVVLAIFRLTRPPSGWRQQNPSATLGGPGDTSLQTP